MTSCAWMTRAMRSAAASYLPRYPRVPASGVGGPRWVQVGAKERQDAPAGILRRGLVVSRSRHEPAQDREQGRLLLSGPFVVVEALVPGLRILLDVVLDPLQPSVPAPSGPPRLAATGPGAVASDDGHAPARKLAV